MADKPKKTSVFAKKKPAAAVATEAPTAQPAAAPAAAPVTAAPAADDKNADPKEKPKAVAPAGAAKAKKPSALGLKINPCNRLLKDLEYYTKDKAKAAAKIDALSKEAGGGDPHDLRTHREFLREATAAFDSTRGKLRDSTNDLLAALRNHKLENPSPPSDPTAAAALAADYEDADRVIRTALTLLDGPAAAIAALGAADAKDQKSSATAAAGSSGSSASAAAAGGGRRRVAVFGSALGEKGSDAWKVAEEVGNRLATAGFHVMSGGYFGTMEAVCAGAAKVKGAVVEGVLCPSAFPGRAHGNEYLTHRTVAPTLMHRLVAFTEPASSYSPAIGSGGADYFVLLPGSIGTFTEFIVAWNLRITNHHIAKAAAVAAASAATATATASASTSSAAAVAVSGPAITPTLFLFRKPWEAVVNGFAEQLGMSKADLQHLSFVDTPAQILERLPSASA